MRIDNIWEEGDKNQNDAKVVKGLREVLVRQNHISDNQITVIKKFFLIKGS